MSLKKIICILSAGALFAAASVPVSADHRYPTRHGGLTASELDTISQFENEANYQRFLGELAFKYRVSPQYIERMAERQGVHRPATKYYYDYARDPRFYDSAR